MIEQDTKTLVPQIPGESDASYCRLIIMLTQGFKDLHQLHDYLEKENHKYYVTYGTLKINSAKDKWTERIRKYDQHIEQQLQQETEQIFQKLNKTSIHEMQEFLQDLSTLRQDVMNRFKDPTQKFNSSSALKALNDYSTCYNRATEIYYINSRHSLVPKEEESTNNTEGVKTFIDWVSNMRGEQ